MPAYDFKCKNCGHAFTSRMSISERDKVRCPECNSKNLQQIFQNFAVQVKGQDTGGCGGCDGGSFG